MFKVFCAFPMPEECLAPYRNEIDFTVAEKRLSYDELKSRMAEGYDAVVILASLVDKPFLDAAAAAGVRVIANNMAGVDKIDLPYATEKGIAITNAPFLVTEATAEHACALIAATMRNLACYDREIRRGVWNAPVFTDRATMIEGSTLGIIGLGRIGKRVAAKMRGMGMKVIYYDKIHMSEEVEKELGVTYVGFEELLKTADCVTLHMPYFPDNHHMINAETLKLMKKSAYLVNASRGALVEEEALAAALKNGELKGAGLDVFEHEPHPIPELLELENVTMTPHCASGTWRSRIDIARETVDGMLAMLKGEVPYQLVNKEILSR